MLGGQGKLLVHTPQSAQRSEHPRLEMDPELDPVRGTTPARKARSPGRTGALEDRGDRI